MSRPGAVGAVEQAFGPRYWPGRRLPDASALVSVVGVGGAAATVESAGAGARALADGVALPRHPSDGLLERWLWLAEVGAADLSVARLYEGHVDALAILDEARHPVEASRLYGVWASKAGGSAVSATDDGPHLVLDGVRPYASGAGTIDIALVAVDRGEDALLVAVDLRAPGVSVEDGSWVAIGMAGSDSATVHLRDVRVDARNIVGTPGWYLDRPGFWPGAVGVAACWFGGAVGVVQPLVQAAVDGSLDEHGLAHLGRTWARLEAAAALLVSTADDLDEGRHASSTDSRRSAETVRAVVEDVAGACIAATGRALGPGPMTGDRVHAQRVADLEVYVRQHHAERDLAALGRLLGAAPW